jgi:hypothetical protein
MKRNVTDVEPDTLTLNLGQEVCPSVKLWQGPGIELGAAVILFPLDFDTACTIFCASTPVNSAPGDEW